MIKISPETLAQAESLDLAMTEPDDLRLYLWPLSSKFWQYDGVLDLGVIASKRARPEGKFREACGGDCLRIAFSLSLPQ
jgi:hypothetical protein